MGYIINDEISYSDSSNLDAFGRLRVSEVETIIETFFPSDKEPLLTDELIIGTGSSTWTSGSTVHMNIGNSTNDKIIRQSKQYATYQPGKSQLVLQSGILNDQGGVVGLRSRVGYFDDKNNKTLGLIRGNGLFFELDGTDLYVVVRKTDTTTGVQTDTRISQSNWNIDTLDGSSGKTNPTNLEIDASKAQVFAIDFEWLGVGRVRFGFFLKGRLYYCHEVTNYNVLTDTYINTPTLPIRWEIENTSGVTHTSKMVQICGSVNTEAPYARLGKIFAIDRGITIRSVSTTLTPLLSVRLKPEYNRATVKLLSSTLQSVTSNKFIRYTIYLNPTLTSPSWVNTNGFAVQYDISATNMDITNAYLLDSGYFSQNNPSESIIENILNITSNIAGVSDIITVAAQATTGTGDILASLRLQERL